MKLYASEYLNKIRKAIDRALNDGATPIAAFDADGTLWDTDLGEHFFDYQIRNRVIAELPDGAWDYYKKLHDVDAPKAYLWLAQINRGHALEEVRDWAQAAFEEYKPVPVFAGMLDIVKHLQKLNVEIYIVTASVKWAVEPGGQFLGIDRDHVLGINTKIEKGLVTDQQEGPITWREGKVTGLLEATQRRAPFFAAGNTMGDLALLDSATHVRLVNTAAPAGDRLRETEEKLLIVAQKRGWYYHVHRE